jgi:8-oxo-dGTP pyrophosphatase MutT (NUDIX family)
VDRAKAKVRFPGTSTDLSLDANAALQDFVKKYPVKEEGKNPLREAVLVAMFKNSVEQQVAPALVPRDDSLVLLGKHSPKSWWAAKTFVPLGGTVEYSDFHGAKTLGDAFSNALLREVEEEAGIHSSRFSHSYVGSFQYKALGYNVHAYCGFLHSDPDEASEDHHLSQVTLSPKNSENDCFMWLPVKHALTSPLVHKAAKHVIRNAVKFHRN